MTLCLQEVNYFHQKCKSPTDGRVHQMEAGASLHVKMCVLAAQHTPVHTKKKDKVSPSDVTITHPSSKFQVWQVSKHSHSH